MPARTLGEIQGDAKSADWKVANAAWMNSNGLCTNRWLAQNLNMGAEFSISRDTSEAKQADGLAQPDCSVN
ncbi:MAG: hypothetical protein HC888_17645 [Candidatus Competibacteraceae bacterium]|nr:hypothetical protein [Candidatus Competibacteraceae bacterium]